MSQMSEVSVVVSEHLNRQLVIMSQELVTRCIAICAERYHFDAEEANRMLGVESLKLERKAAAKKVGSSRWSQKSTISSVPPGRRFAMAASIAPGHVGIMDRQYENKIVSNGSFRPNIRWASSCSANPCRSTIGSWPAFSENGCEATAEVARPGANPNVFSMLFPAVSSIS